MLRHTARELLYAAVLPLVALVAWRRALAAEPTAYGRMWRLAPSARRASEQHPPTRREALEHFALTLGLAGTASVAVGVGVYAVIYGPRVWVLLSLAMLAAVARLHEDLSSRLLQGRGASWPVPVSAVVSAASIGPIALWLNQIQWEQLHAAI